MLKLDISKVTPFVGSDIIEDYTNRAIAAQQTLVDGTCPGNDFLGWLNLPASITPEFLGEVKAVAQTLREECEAVVVAGIGGS